MGTVPPFSKLIAATVSSAVHLDMRDAYTPDDQRFLDWLAGKPRQWLADALNVGS